MATACGIVTLTTDFGLEDPFVGEVKGAMLSVRSDLRLVDLTHAVPPHDIEAGAFVLERGYRSFPEGSVHLAVVDPGVGTARRAVAVETERYFFVAPDNGLLARALRHEEVVATHELREPAYRRNEVSHTFEGRDRFAPAAAWVAAGLAVDRLGPAVGELIGHEPTVPRGARIRVRVLVVDRFGNATLDLDRETIETWLAGAPGARLRVVAPGGAVGEQVRTYDDGPENRPFLLYDSSGHLEIAMRRRRAADPLRLAAGTGVTVERVGPDDSAAVE